MDLQVIHNKIYEIRGFKIMLDYDLAALYEVETRILKQAVKRNINRFPVDFMFELSEFEIQEMVSQNVIPSKGKFGGANPMAFTEQGLAMLSGILNSEKAINVNISIMRTFVILRQNILLNKDVQHQIKELEKKYDKQFKDVYDALNFLINDKKKETTQKQRKQIGFKSDN